MNSRPTIQQYRRLAEGLLRKALDAPVESKQDLIYHAVSYLAFARAQEQSGEATVNSSLSHLPNSDETERPNDHSSSSGNGKSTVICRRTGRLSASRPTSIL
jgi:hypothetical protein